MNRTSLEQYLEDKSQASLARAVGLSQGAISKMLRAGRNVMVIEHDDGKIELIEERLIRRATADSSDSSSPH